MTKKKMGRPSVQFDWVLVKGLCGLNTSERYLAVSLLEKDGIFNPGAKQIATKITLIQRRIRELHQCTFVEFRTICQEGFKIQLLQTMIASAIKDKNVQMMIHMGKQYLGHSEKVDSKLGNVKDEKLVLAVHDYADKKPDQT